MITLPSNTLWVTDLAVAIIPGDEEPWTETWYPPAAWAQYDKPCDTCGGTQQVGVHEGCRHPDSPEHRCPDCRDGRQVWELRTECDCACHRLKSKYPGISHDVLGQCRRDGTCDEGSVPLGRFTVQVVPVVKYGEHRLVGTYVVVEVQPGSARCFLMSNTDLPVEQVEFTLDPLPVPGRDFAVIIRRVPS